jgi:hypothetical protein
LTWYGSRNKGKNIKITRPYQTVSAAVILELYVKSSTYCGAKNNIHQVALVDETNELVQAVH